MASFQTLSESQYSKQSSISDTWKGQGYFFKTNLVIYKIILTCAVAYGARISTGVNQSCPTWFKISTPIYTTGGYDAQGFMLPLKKNRIGI